MLFPLILQTIAIAQVLSNGGEGGSVRRKMIDSGARNLPLGRERK